MTPFGSVPIDRAKIANSKAAFEAYGVTPDQLQSWVAQGTLFANDVYQVTMYELQGGAVHLAIRRLDGAPAHNWEELQAIKNALVGEECEALELYPAESRRAFASVHAHLWCQRSQRFRFPFGFGKMHLEGSSPAGSVEFK